MSADGSLSTTMPSTDQDVVMKPLPATLASSSVKISNEELVEQYRSPKRRYRELEEKHDETSQGLERSDERNVRMREERSQLLDTINSPEKPHPGIQDLGASSSQQNTVTNAALSEYAQRSGGTLPGPPSSSTSPSLNSSTLLPQGTKIGNTDEPSAPTQKPDIPSPSSSVAGSSQNGKQKASETDEAGVATTSKPPASGPSRNMRRSTRLSTTTDHELAKTSSEPPKTRKAVKGKGRVIQNESDNAARATAITSGVSKHSIHSSSPPASIPKVDPSPVGATTEANQLPKEISPMADIVRVAEAAIAAQNAASTSPAPSTTSTTREASSSAASSSTPPTSSAPTSSVTSSSPSASTNPYMALLPGKINTGVSPLSMNPYAMYYGPGTPSTPGASPYSPYGNPYYYLTAMSGPSSGYSPTGQRPPNFDTQRPVKPKRLKAHTVTSKSFSIPMVPRDKQGKPMLPLNVGIMTVISLGEVCLREHFHTERYIFPVGFEVTRRYLSTINPNIEVVYHCTILDGGDGPKFQIVPSDVPDRPIIAGTATGAWSSIVKQANSIRNRQHSNSVSGPDFFGLGQNTIKHLIQELPNADRLRDYVWQTFIEGGPLGGRHAAVIPALPEEYDSAMPIGAYYPTASELEKRKRETGVHAQPPSANGISYYPQHIIAQAEAQRQQSPQQIQEPNTQPLPTEGATSVLSSPIPHIDVNLMNLEHFHAQLANSAEQTPQGSDAGARPQSGTPVSSVPATIVGIMQALQPVAGSGASTPAPAQ